MSFDPIHGLSPEQFVLVEIINNSPKWNREKVLERLKADLQTAIHIELATIPTYLYTYYSINRQPSGVSEGLSLFANKSGGTIMSVAVEEMLHMSLASNILFALGELPKMYGHSPDYQSQSGGGTNLPHHKADGPDGKPMVVNLERLGYDTMWTFLEIEYPKPILGPLRDDNWGTIGEFYAYIQCLIASKYVQDSDFTAGEKDKQISNDYYAQNCIDTIYPSDSFDKSKVPMEAGSAASVAVYPNSGDAHAGYEGSPDNDKVLNKVYDKKSAIQAIMTICDQGEGFAGKWPAPEKPTDNPEKTELSHYYKFLEMQSAMVPYKKGCEKHPWFMKMPEAAAVQYTQDELNTICYPYPKNPTTAGYPTQLQLMSDLCNGIYQYLYLMTEATYTVSGAVQVEVFNVGVHKAMIWLLDKIIQSMHNYTFDVGGETFALAPTFENYDLYQGSCDAKANLLAIAAEIEAKAKLENPTQQAEPNSYTNQVNKTLKANNIVDLIKQLPDVQMLPTQGTVAPVEVKHACMGLNACKGQGRKLQATDPDNSCAGTGMCYTSNNHTCHTLNDCKHQGGCGLYGSSEEQLDAGGNQCKGHGSCATPINAERFATAPEVAGQSVWQLARTAFEKRMNEEGKTFGSPPDEAYQTVNGEKVAVGPSFEFIKQNGCVTACGSSGMSGAGSCGG